MSTDSVQGKFERRSRRGTERMKPDQRRSELRQRLLEAAERQIVSDGLQALRTRQLAADVGCALGQIYNIYRDLDSLILAVNARTLDELDERLTAATAPEGPAPANAPAAVLVAQAQAYLRFAIEHRNRWHAVFQHRMAGGRERPAWYREQQARLFSHVDRPLRTLVPELAPPERALLGHSIFSAVHGIVWLGIEEVLGPQSHQELSAQLEIIVLATVRGLQH